MAYGVRPEKRVVGGTPHRLPERAPRLDLSVLVDAALDLGFATACLSIWVTGGDPGLVRNVAVTVVLEFLVIHSAVLVIRALLAPDGPALKTMSVATVLLVDTLALCGVATVFDTWWPLVAFWAQSINRVAGCLWRGHATGDRRPVIEAWAAALFVYLGAGVLTHNLPLPLLGMAAQAKEGPFEHLDFWHGEPHRVVAFATLYFAAMALSKLHGHRWVKSWKPDGGWLAES